MSQYDFVNSKYIFEEIFKVELSEQVNVRENILEKLR